MAERKKLKFISKDGLKNIKPKTFVMWKMSRSHVMSVSVRTAYQRLKIALLCIALICTCVGAFIFQSCNQVPDNYTIDSSFATVYKPAPTNGTKPTDYSALDNVAFLHHVFKNQPDSYVEITGETDAMGIIQKVETYKQTKDGVSVITEITSSSMVNSAKQFCITNGRVIWRTSASENFNGLNTVWKDGSPAGNMFVDTFKEYYGLPTNEFSSYVINEETLINADAEIIDNEDGTYSMTLSLTTDKLGAPAYYAKQMVFSGGLNDYPIFDYINITYTFDANWQILLAEVNEAYDAKMGITAYCVSNFRSEYSYGTENSSSSAYEDYFKEYEEQEGSNGPIISSPTSAGCLGEAFAPVLQGPTTFNLSLNVNGTAIDGKIYLDVSKALNSDDMLGNLVVRADLGNIKLWLENGEAYLYANGIKAKLGVNDLIDLISSLTNSEQTPVASPYSATISKNIATTQADGGLDFSALLNQLGGGEFTYVDFESASLNSTLELLGISIPLEFAFNLDEQNKPSLNFVGANVAISGIEIGATLNYGETTVEPLEESEKANYVDLVKVANTVIDILNSDNVQLEVNAKV